MEPKPSQEQLTDYMRKLSQLHQEVFEQKISEEEAILRLEGLRYEHQRLVNSGEFPLNKQVAIEPTEEKEIMKSYNRDNSRSKKDNKIGTRQQQGSTHEFSFTCQCPRCVSKHTITMADKDFLQSLKIKW